MLTVRRSGVAAEARGNCTTSDDALLAVARGSRGPTLSDCGASICEALLRETSMVLCVALLFVAPQTRSWKRVLKLPLILNNERIYLN